MSYGLSMNTGWELGRSRPKGARADFVKMGYYPGGGGGGMTGWELDWVGKSQRGKVRGEAPEGGTPGGGAPRPQGKHT